MAQFGKNLYGASYYGASGAYHGQFLSDETALLQPLAASSLVFDLDVFLRTKTYTADNDIYRYTGVWTIGASSSSSDTTMEAAISITCSNFGILFTQGASGAKATITTTRYIEGVAQTPTVTTVDTSASASYSSGDIPFGEYVIAITMDATSPVGSSITLNSITAIVNDISVELRSTTQDISLNQWGAWSPTTITRTYNTETARYDFSATLANTTGILGYQFRVLLATSDDTTTPEVYTLKVHTISTENYAENGYWKMVIDLGATVENIQSITFTDNKTDNSNIEIRTRTSDDPAVETQSDTNMSWEPWSVPYSDSTYRMLLDIKNNTGLQSGYIISPLINPENLTHWLTYLPTMFINYQDPITGDANKNTSITIQFLGEDLSLITTNGIQQSFQYYESENIEHGISSITQPIRVKIIINRALGYTTPAIDAIALKAEADYTEIKAFSSTGIKAYGSAVFGSNTGKDPVYLDNLIRSQVASISNLAYVLPSGVTNVEYSIANVNIPGFSSDQLKIYWNSESGKENKTGKVNLSAELPDDYVIVEVRADNDIVKKHTQYLSGITIKVDDVGKTNYDAHVISNIFSPTLDSTKTYAYHLANGFSEDTKNANVDIRWLTENVAEIETRRNISYTSGGTVLASIVTTTDGGLVSWKSEERIFSGVVNTGSPAVAVPTRIILGSAYDLPQIPGEIITNETPYKVEIIDGSVTSEGEVVSNSRITITMNNAENVYIPVTEEKVAITKSSSSVDFLPKARTVSVSGIYAATDDLAPTYTEGIHFTLVDGNKIDWSIGIDAQLTVPSADAVIYITYTYEKIWNAYITASSSYSKSTYDIMNIYRTSPIIYSGRCSYGSDYISNIYDINTLWTEIPTAVDKTTLNLRVVVSNNDFVNAYIKDGRVIGTLANTNPRENWYPHIKDGFYYIGKDEHYLFVNPYVAVLNNTTVPMAQNITYVDTMHTTGVLLQEESTNLFINSKLDLDYTDIDTVFRDDFSREENGGV